MEVRLREVEDDDLEVMWGYVSDPEFQHVAAVTRDYHYDRDAFDRHAARVRAAPDVLHFTVLVDDVVAGEVAAFGPPDEREVTYSIGRPFWGRGVATAALGQLLALEPARPLHAGAAADNVGSLRVLEKCGFVVTGRARDASMDRGGDIDVLLLALPADAG